MALQKTTYGRPRGGGAITNLLIRLDRAVREGLQEQIYASIRRAILEGVVVPGARLPSSRALAADLGVSRTTTLLVLEQLVAEGYLIARRGSGTFVTRELPDDLPQPRPRPVGKPIHPPLSKRACSLAATPPAARWLGRPAVPFRIGTPALELFPLRTWSRILNRRVRNLSAGDLDYGERGGYQPLREAIAEYVRTSRGTRCDAGQVVIVAGAQRGLELACQALLDPGDEVWMEDPGYPGARSALLGAGARIVPLGVDAEGLTLDVPRRRRSARLVFVTPSHQFPLGVPMSLARRLALLKWASEAQAWVIEDDYDSEFRHGARPIPCLHGLDVDGRVIYLGSFSKTLFPALRLGFLIVPPDVQEGVLAARRAVGAPPTLDQATLADFMREGHFERHLRRMRTVYRERLEALDDAIQRSCGGVLKLQETRTGLHALAGLTGVDALAVSHQAALQGIEAMPVSAYVFGNRKATNGLVLGFGASPPDALTRGVQRLATAIEAAERAQAKRLGDTAAQPHREAFGS